MKQIAILVLMLATAMTLAADDKKASVLLQAGQAKETLQGDLKAAIDLYTKAAKEAGANHELAAKAWLHLGQCHEKLGDAQARAAYERIVSEYGDQKEAAGEARARLAMLGGIRGSSALVVRQVKMMSERDEPWQVSPDGRKVAINDWGKGDVAIVDLATGDKRVLTHDAGDPDGSDLIAWSQDGRQIAYGWWTKTGWDLRLIGADGTGERTLYRCSPEIRNMEPAAWSADGKEILVTINRRDRSVQIAWISVADGTLRVLKTIADNVDPMLRLSPDGRHIAYEVRKQGRKDISLMSNDGAREAVLVEHPANDYLAGWTPDGKRFLFASDRTGTTSLWAIAVADGKPQGEPELIRRDLGAQEIHPFGITRNGALYYTLQARAMSDIYTAELDPITGKVVSPARLVKVNRSGSNVLPQWSPDGKRLLYSFQQTAGVTGGVRELWITDMDSGNSREILPNLNFAGGPRTWYPDGRSILIRAFAGDRQTGLHKVDLETGADAKEGQAFVLTTWSRDLRMFSGVRSNDSLITVNTETGEEKTLLKLEKRKTLMSQAISPDGRQVAMALAVADGFRLIQVMTISTGATRELVRIKYPSFWRGWGIAWSPDGRYVFYSKFESDPHRYTLWRVPAAGGESVNTGITMTDLRDINVSPDGRRVAFSAGRLSGSETWVMENFLPAADRPMATSR